MTILNAWITPSEATVMVDTDATKHADGSRWVTSKFLPIPHLNAGIGGRGNSLFHDMIAVRCRNAGFESFDEMLDEMPETLLEAEPWIQKAKTYGEAGFELLAVGWSDRKGRMLGRHFVKRGDIMQETSIRDVDDSQLISPWHASLSGLSTHLSGAERLACAQARWMQSFPNSFAGGKLLCFRIMRNSMEMTVTKMQMELQEAAA